MDTKLYELINPSDRITFRATLEEAACIADRMRPALYFVKDVETGEEPTVEDLQSVYDAIWKDAAKLASYAAAYDSFLVGSTTERELFEKAASLMLANEARAYRKEYDDKRRSSFNDICGQCWAAAERIAAYEPEAA